MTTTPMTVGTRAPSRLPLFLALGCVGSVVLLCVGSVGAFFTWQYYVRGEARSHATSFLTALVGHDYPGAFSIGVSRYDTDLYSVGEFTACFTSTPLAVATAATCHDTDVSPDGRDAEVHCTLTTPTGPTEITVDVNNPTRDPYNGFVWFSPDAVVGPLWHSDACTSWSGREYYREPPLGRVRP